MPFFYELIPGASTITVFEIPSIQFETLTTACVYDIQLDEPLKKIKKYQILVGDLLLYDINFIFGLPVHI
jgi:hypothetical protein